MPTFSQRSLDRLKNVHPDLQTLMHHVIEDFDITVLCGLRTQEEQSELYAKGRWKPGKIVTFKDGIERRSKHQDGMAVDVAPYPIDWDDTERFNKMGLFILETARKLKQDGLIDHDVAWGGTWRFKDYPHFEI